jgi:hypothetical protein
LQRPTVKALFRARSLGEQGKKDVLEQDRYCVRLTMCAPPVALEKSQ